MGVKENIEACIANISLEIATLNDNAALIEDPCVNGFKTPHDYELNEQSVYFSPSAHIASSAAHWEASNYCHGYMAANIPDGAGLFFGDSNMEGLCTQAIDPYAVNLGISGDIQRGLIHRTKAYEPLSRAGYVVVMVGTNDFASEGANWVYNTPLFAQKIHNHFKGGPLIRCLIPPVTSSVQTTYMTQANINTINAAIISDAANYPNVTVVDIATPLKNGGTYLHSSYSLDGIHLNAAGQAVVINAIKTAIENL